MKNLETLVLEPSTNTHTLKSKIKVAFKNITNSIMKLTVKEGSEPYVEHGEHGTVAIESEHTMKFVQQEYNPITKAMQNAYD